MSQKVTLREDLRSPSGDDGEAERRIAATLDSITDGFLRLSADWRVVYVNAEAERIDGRSRTDLIGKRIWDVWPHTAGTPLETQFHRAVADRSKVEFENFYEPWNRWFTIKAFPTAEGGLEIFYNDITKRKQAEEALRESETKYRTLFESIDEGFCIIEFFDGPHGPLSDYIHVDANPAYTANAGIPDIVGKKVREMVPDEAEEWVRVYRNVLITGEPIRFERELVATGRYLDLAAFRIEPSERRQVAVLFKDITRRKRAEDELREASRRKDEFLATLAHELRNPLAPIRNGLRIMKLAAEDADLVEKSRTIVERQVNHMAHLIDDLMDLSRISRGKIVLQKARFRLAEAVQDAVETARPLIDERRHELVLAMPPGPILVEADRTRLSQVFGNLLNNAAKYTEAGGRIRVTVERDAGEVVVGIEDNGVGIPADMLPKVFDMFTQVDRSLEKAQGGLGIGLSIVQRLVEMHDGRIAVESGGHGQGSRFVVRLPVVLSRGTTSAVADGEEMIVAAPRRRILVADDNRDAATSLAMLLRILGNDAQTASDGLQALEVGAAFKPHLVLLDIGMPNLNGFETCRRIRQEEWGKQIVVVACTGWGQDDDRRKSEEAGFDMHLVKPIASADLQNLLAGLVPAT